MEISVPGNRVKGWAFAFPGDTSLEYSLWLHGGPNTFSLRGK